MVHLEQIISQTKQHAISHAQNPEVLRQGKRAIQYAKEHGVARHDGIWSERPIRILPHIFPQQQGEAFFFHRHHCFELIYLYEGQAVNYFSDHSIRLKAGDVLLLNPSISHSFCTTGIDDVAFNVQITKEAFDQSFLTMLSDNDLFLQFFMDTLYQVNLFSDYLYFPFQETDDIKPVFTVMAEEFFSQASGSEKMVSALLSAVLVRLARNYHEQAGLSRQKDGHAQKMLSILSYLNQHCAEVTLPDAASRFGYSEKYLSRMIKKATGKTFQEIVTNTRLGRAQEMLLNSGLPIDQIAQEIGYSAPTAFYQAFKKRYLQTPSEFRKQNSQQKRK